MLYRLTEYRKHNTCHYIPHSGGKVTLTIFTDAPEIAALYRSVLTDFTAKKLMQPAIVWVVQTNR